MHIINEFSFQSYRLRGKVRSLHNTNKLEPIHKINNTIHPIELVEANLLDDEHAWLKILNDVTVIIHVASPFPSNNLLENEIIQPAALDGT